MNQRNIAKLKTFIWTRFALVLVVLSVLKLCYLILLSTNNDQVDVLSQPLPWKPGERSAVEISTTTTATTTIIEESAMTTVQQNGTGHQRFTHVTTFDMPPSTNTSEQPCFLQVQVWIHRHIIRKPRDYTCPGLTCNIRYVAGMSIPTMERSDVLIYYYKSPWNFERMQKRRPEGQKWVYFTRESPQHINELERRKWPKLDYFMTYGRFGDIPNSYGYFDAHTPEIRTRDAQNWARNKTRLIAWASSNCGGLSWKRKDFVHELSKHIHVDMYGSCGNLNCKKNSVECDRLLRSYKFHLALENSECRDYITEKFWKNSLQSGVVPLVYGAPKEDYARVAPPNSFIHLQDFASMAELADYIRLLDSDDSRYNAYLEWKQFGSAVALELGDILTPEYMCNVVDKVVRDREGNNKYPSGARSLSGFPAAYSKWSTSCVEGVGFPHDF